MRKRHPASYIMSAPSLDEHFSPQTLHVPIDVGVSLSLSGTECLQDSNMSIYRLRCSSVIWSLGILSSILTEMQRLRTLGQPTVCICIAGICLMHWGCASILTALLLDLLMWGETAIHKYLKFRSIEHSGRLSGKRHCRSVTKMVDMIQHMYAQQS